MTKRTKSSRRWLAEHESDVFVQRARASGYRSRAVYKLEEIQRKDRILKPGMTIVDLGAAPGGWSQYVASVMKGKGRVIASDILAMEEISGVEFLQGDFSSDEVLAELVKRLKGSGVDVVLCDMAPNMMGISDVDHARSMQLVEEAADFARKTLSRGGTFLTKVFQGRDFQPLMRDLRASFGSVAVRKPDASRARSAELYVLARDFKGEL